MMLLTSDSFCLIPSHMKRQIFNKNFKPSKPEKQGLRKISFYVEIPYPLT